ncbi:Glyoxalase/Bleomycin resistance protein/Dioxygenase superfamily protein [Halobacillus karajensis]|uniref:Uncharacterized protein n=1 Tax=Halobacillus karajensis TaxID=195088 RepID=A0A024P5S9_9BACI|nr:VOC family protein [Halobacillus karajensis]CDQ20403.1 hypothetical protein BN982_02742 [Halobacillus karajensis]CDQ24128.1 hypothetical protein BN983_02395 [Halobacillus karajensis]CDQ27606.1 hypothetical protein BN981_01876 [Halobacillus karajensis]SEH92209.1 Glyoxalase/Bleomycin resistance protein/Dioxygenase superfamily protein [Halobacillus karajensis]
MTKSVQAYFATENDAESAKASLQSLSIGRETVEAIPEDTDMTPIIPVAGSTNSGGGTFNFTEVVSPKQDHEHAKSDKKTLTHILHFTLPAEEIERALQIIKDHKGYINRKDME